MLPTKFQFVWESGFREDFFLEINRSETCADCIGRYKFDYHTITTTAALVLFDMLSILNDCHDDMFVY